MLAWAAREGMDESGGARAARAGAGAGDADAADADADARAAAAAAARGAARRIAALRRRLFPAPGAPRVPALLRVVGAVYAQLSRRARGAGVTAGELRAALDETADGRRAGERATGNEGSRACGKPSGLRSHPPHHPPPP